MNNINFDIEMFCNYRCVYFHFKIVYCTSAKYIYIYIYIYLFILYKKCKENNKLINK